MTFFGLCDRLAIGVVVIFVTVVTHIFEGFIFPTATPTVLLPTVFNYLHGGWAKSHWFSQIFEPLKVGDRCLDYCISRTVGILNFLSRLLINEKIDVSRLIQSN
jgi:predicted membrane protein